MPLCGRLSSRSERWGGINDAAYSDEVQQRCEESYIRLTRNERGDLDMKRAAISTSEDRCVPVPCFFACCEPANRCGAEGLDTPRSIWILFSPRPFSAAACKRWFQVSYSLCPLDLKSTACVQ